MHVQVLEDLSTILKPCYLWPWISSGNAQECYFMSQNIFEIKMWCLQDFCALKMNDTKFSNIFPLPPNLQENSTDVVIIIVLIRFWIPIFSCYRHSNLGLKILISLDLLLANGNDCFNVLRTLDLERLLPRLRRPLTSCEQIINKITTKIITLTRTILSCCHFWIPYRINWPPILAPIANGIGLIRRVCSKFNLQFIRSDQLTYQHFCI